MKRVLGLLLALTVMIGMSSIPSFSQPQEKKTEGKKDGKKKAEKGEKGEKKKGEGKKKGEKKDSSK